MKRKPKKTPAESRRTSATARGTYVRSIMLERVRCFGVLQTLDLSDETGRPAPWTIIVGKNGTGKTTLLQSLCCFAASGAGTAVSQYGATFCRGEADPCHIQIEYGAGSTLGSRSEPALRSTAHVTISPGLEPKLVPPPVAPLCFGYGAGRRLGDSTLTATGSTATGNLFDDNVPLRNAEQWLLRLDYAANKRGPERPTHRRRLAQLRRLLIEVLPEDVTDLRIREPVGGPRPVAAVEFHTPDGWVPLRRLGYGYQTLIAWMVDFASRMVECYPDSADPLVEPAVVLVDEIDLHLHPTWQRGLIGYLSARFPNTQFIATTQSPIVVQAAPAAGANVALLRRCGDHVEIENRVPPVRGWRIDQILTSDLFGLESARPPEFDALFARRKQLLVRSRPTAAQRRELDEIEQQIGFLPGGETAEQARRVLDLVRDTHELLRKYQAKP